VLVTPLPSHAFVNVVIARQCFIMILPPETLTRYCGEYVIDDLEQLRLSVARITSFNDPFELHFKVSKPLTRSSAKKHLRSRMQREGFWKMAAARFPGLTRKELKRVVANTRGQLVSKHIALQESVVESHRRRPWVTMERHARLMCFTEPKHHDPAEIPMWGYYAAKLPDCVFTSQNTSASKHGFHLFASSTKMNHRT
jgi:hypothetical protein